MSGCVIARWVDRGVTYVGHIGTVEGYGTENRQVKRKFSFAMPKGTTGFSPANAWSFSELQTVMQNVGTGFPPNIIALVTTRGEFYSIVMVKTGSNTYQSGGIRRCNPIEHDTLKLQMLRD